MREIDLLLCARMPEHEEQAAFRASLDPGNVVVGNAEHSEDNQRGQFPSEIVNQIGAAVYETLASEARREFTDEGFHRGDPTRRKGDIREAPDSSVRRRIGVG